MRAVLALCCALAAGWALWPAGRPAPGLLAVAVAPVPEPLQGPVRVIDGDTFDLGGVRVRLHGVDAPERGQICRDAQGRDWACGAWATGQVRALIGERPLVCHDLGERTHGRVVAACRLDGQDLGAQLVAAGIVRACPRYARRHLHARGYEALEARAIAARVGLHAGTTPPRAGFCEPQPAA
jgi:endonuclease YncB( thermonuclease family)